LQQNLIFVLQVLNNELLNTDFLNYKLLQYGLFTLIV